MISQIHHLLLLKILIVASRNMEILLVKNSQTALEKTLKDTNYWEININQSAQDRNIHWHD
jgi:hypothetical protein